jgi:hypothetical protein
MKTKNILAIAALAAVALYACQKEDSTATPSTEKGTLSAVKTSSFMLTNETGSPFTIVYAGVNTGSISLGLKYQATANPSKFSIVWDGKFEEKDDSTFINLSVVRDANGVVQNYEMHDSLYTNLTSLGITLANLEKEKTVVKITNGSNLSQKIYIKLEKGNGSWPIYPVVVTPGTGTDPGTGGGNPPADSSGRKR